MATYITRLDYFWISYRVVAGMFETSFFRAVLRAGDAIKTTAWGRA
jgi:hypothetical protein